MFRIILCATAAAVLLITTGCAIEPVQPGASRSDVISRYGNPTGVVALPTGTRLQYSQQPMGQHALMVDLDASGRVASTREVLTPGEFARVVPGKWTRQDMEREFGPPAIVERVASWPGDLMTYRWRDVNQDMLFSAYLDGNQVVQRTGQTMEIRPEMPDGPL